MLLKTIMKNKISQILCFSFLITFFGCQPPFISIYMLEESEIQFNNWVNLSPGNMHSIDTNYSSDSLNVRLKNSHSIDIYSYELDFITSTNVFLKDDSLFYTIDSFTYSLKQDSVRQLIIYDESKTSRALTRAGYLGGFLGGLALLAYIPPNPKNESPVSTVYIMTGSGIVLGIAMGDIGSQREIVAFVRKDEVEWD